MEPELAATELAVAVATVTAAGLMRGFAGFGSGMLMARIFAILFGPVDAVTMVALLELFASVQLLPQVLKDAQWGFVAPLSLSAMLFMPLGAYVLRRADPTLLTKLMASVVLIFVTILLGGRRYYGEKKPLLTLAVGAVSGALMAATSMGNPPILLYLLAGRDRAKTIRANIIAYFAVTQIVLLSCWGSWQWSHCLPSSEQYCSRRGTFSRHWSAPACSVSRMNGFTDERQLRSCSSLAFTGAALGTPNTGGHR